MFTTDNSSLWHIVDYGIVLGTLHSITHCVSIAILPYSHLFTWRTTFVDVFNLPWAGYFHRCIVRDWHIDELTLRRIDKNVNFINGFTLACHGWFAKFVKHSCYMVWEYQCRSIKIYSQLSILGMLGMSSVYLCAREWLKNDDIVACIVAAFFQYAHAYSLSGNLFSRVCFALWKKRN